ncbi:MAG: YihY/virulence factor BrkB family protein [Sulfitobacter sp.]|nr:YihY/virulence factor BrkB family protein [Sulfitobacter sp.]
MTRGRQAEKPTEIPSRGWRDILFRVKVAVGDDRLSLIAAGVAYYGLLALFPAITAAMAIAGLIVEPPQVIDMMNSLEGLMPQEVLTIVTDQATKVAGSREGGLGLTVIVGLLLAIYSASKGVGSLMEGMNVAYNEEEKRGFFVLTAVKLILTLFAIFGALAGLALVGAIPALIALDSTGFLMDLLIGVGGVALTIALTIFGLSIFYRYGPSRENARWRWITPGAVAACIVWVLGSAGFAFYVGNFGSYNETFGAMAGIIVLLVWMWLSAFIVLFGAELNAEMEAQTKVDTTDGKVVPMGSRGATKADRLGETTG